MRIHALIGCLLGLSAQLAQGKAVFAHFMLSNTEVLVWNSPQWLVEFTTAKEAKIDGFAINIAAGESLAKLDDAFYAANLIGFKLIFSFDYAGNGPWKKGDVVALLRKYKDHPAYFKHPGGRPLVSTFEGPDQSGDWSDIKSDLGAPEIYFIPDWSSLGAWGAVGKGVADGLFNWAAWPEGTREMDTYVDASYVQALGGEGVGNTRYMMPVSPWFYTNLPQYNKNWMWLSRDAWYDRWVQVLTIQPEYVQIISWNDFGESHYIGPLRSNPPMDSPMTPFDYTHGMYHDGWLKTLPFWIDMYKTGTASVTKERIVAWYSLTSGPGCDDMETSVNTATHLQLEMHSVYATNYIYFDAVLGSDADVEITIGGETGRAPWNNKPHGGVGVYHGKFYVGNRGGEVRIRLHRNGNTIATINGAKRIGRCEGAFTNFNAYVDHAESAATIAAKSPPLKVQEMKCVNGFGVGDFYDICKTSCSMGYCPLGACVCTDLGAQPTLPKATGEKGYTYGDPSYIGLCDFTCNYGLCLRDVCSPTEKPLVVPTVSPFLPDTCTGGQGKDPNQQRLNDLCKFSCKYGNCPISVCQCTSTGPLNDIKNSFTEQPGISGRATENYEKVVDINNMCAFTCKFGHCPIGICSTVRTPGSGNNDGGPRPSYYADPKDNAQRPVCDQTYTSLDELERAAGSIPLECGAEYLLPLALDSIQKSVSRYKQILSDGYDKYFDIYAEYIVRQAPTAIQTFMNEHGNDFFTCEVVEQVRCCRSCAFAQKSCKWCNYENCNVTSPYDDGLTWERKRQPCPPDFSQRGQGPHYEQTIYWTLRKDKENDFYDAVQERIGAGKDDIEWPDFVRIGSIDASCARNPPDKMPESCLRQHHWFGAPAVRGFTEDEVVNPKRILEQALDKANTLIGALPVATWEILTGHYWFDTDAGEATAEDVVDAVLIPVFMLEEAVVYMEEVVRMAKEIKEAEKKQMILMFLSALFLGLSILGTALAGLGLSVLSRSLILIGELGGTALGIEGVVSDPSTAPLFIFGLIMSGKSIRDGSIALRSAKLARGMTHADVAKLGEAIVHKRSQAGLVMNKAAMRKMCYRYA